MVSISPPMSRPAMGILLGGGVAATCDIVYAILRQAGYGRDPVWVLQSVASGLLGQAAFESGVPGAVLGLVCHYSILLVAALTYYLASRRFPVLVTQALACGALFGITVYLFMNFVVLPLSAFPFSPSYPALKLLEGFASHALFVGIPIALSVRHFAPPQGYPG
jgi:hypothetical protein